MTDARSVFDHLKKKGSRSWYDAGAYDSYAGDILTQEMPMTDVFKSFMEDGKYALHQTVKDMEPEEHPKTPQTSRLVNILLLASCFVTVKVHGRL